MRPVMQIFILAIFSKSVVLLVECKPYFAKRGETGVINPNNLEIVNDGSTKDISYDDYPLVVPKRAAMLLDRLMVALHHALEDEDGNPRKINEVYRDGSFYATTQTITNNGQKGKLNRHRPRTSALHQPRQANHHDHNNEHTEQPNKNNKNIVSLLQPSSASELSSSVLEGADEFSPKYDSENVLYVVVKGNPALAEDAEGIDGGLPPSEFAVGGAELLLPGDQNVNVRNNEPHHHQGVDETMDLQRRGHGSNGLGPNKGRVYWRCYFNAVTCF